MDDHNFFCALLCSACSTTCRCIAVWTVESNSDFLRPICRNSLCISGLGISRQTGFNLEFPSPRWIACQGYELHPTHTLYRTNKPGPKSSVLKLPLAATIRLPVLYSCTLMCVNILHVDTICLRTLGIQRFK